VLPIAGILIYYILRPPETLAETYERALEEEALLQEIEERPSCAGCSRTIDPNWMLCPHCHTRARKKCRDCGELMDLQWNLCPHCGNHHVDPYQAQPPETTTTDYDELPAVRRTGIPSLESVVDQPTMPMTSINNGDYDDIETT
jgi:RNA polymerase subunit RPABC4/transcription elongation factor Spt4